MDTLNDYSKRVEFLKQLGSLKVAFSILSNVKINDGICYILKQNSFETMKPFEQQQQSVVKLPNPGPIMTKKDMKPKQLYHKTQLNQEKILRESLLGTAKSPGNLLKISFKNSNIQGKIVCYGIFFV